MTDPNDHLTTTEAAAYLGVAPTTMARWRHKGIGPVFTRPGFRFVQYERSELDRWKESRKGAPAGVPGD